MKHKPLTGITLSAYAAHRKALGLTGASRQAVHLAVKAKRVSLLSDGSIDATAADAEWMLRTDPSKQRTTAPPQGRAPARAVTRKPEGAAPEGGEYHDGQVQAVARITSVGEVLGFAVTCIGLGCSREVACAIAQQYSLRTAEAVEDITCDDLQDERFVDPTPEQWYRELGEFDLDDADALCDSVSDHTRKK